MSKIIVAGAGHGGVVAAAELAKAGFDVTVYEKNTYESIGLPQSDVFDGSAMEFAGIEFPEHWRSPNNVITFVPSDPEVTPITMPEDTSARSLTVDRHKLITFLIDFAVKCGVGFEYGTDIKSPIILGNRVVGIQTDKGPVYGDLIIDACGVNSPLRSVLPDFMSIQKTPGNYDVLHSYRASFMVDPSQPKAKYRYNIILNENGTVGMSWLINEETYSDALICRFAPMDLSDASHALWKTKEQNPHMGTELIRGGRIVDIPVRQPLAVLVADGYAAVGDSAFMTVPFKGSGIGFSIMAGKMLADACLNDGEKFFTAQTLWEYEKRFFEKTGFSACRLALLKNILPYITADEVSDMFRENLVTTEELSMFMSNGISAVLNTGTISLIREKLKVLSGHPELRSKLLDIPVWFTKFAIVERFFPQKYSREDVAKWNEKYNEFFESIKSAAPPEKASNGII